MIERGPVELRRHPRRRVSWPVILETDDRISFVETVDFGARGAKLWLRVAPPLGSLVNLHFHPEQGGEMHVQAVTWRSDPDGVAFFFIGLGSPLRIEAPPAANRPAEVALAG